MKKEEILKELVKIYTDYRDIYDGKKVKVEANQDFSDDHGYENMWWINLEIVDEMWDDILGLFKDKKVQEEFNKIRQKFYDEWEAKQKRTKQAVKGEKDATHKK